MKRLPHLLALLAIASLAACDPQNSPGKDPQRSEDISQIPPATANETNRDSISSQQRVEKPIGKGSAADQAASGSGSLQQAPGDRSSPTSTIPTKSTEQQGKAQEEQ
ncbi:hypothetical protein [Hymenobacter sp.]|jgi:hypothetical protein|uniref:hypothetical protein n=1 Tax=Hymenobacter sp. TaxID=1898978 RepID=UPI002ED796FE